MNKYNSTLFHSMSTMLLFGLFRISEITGDKRIGIPPLRQDQIQVKKKALKIRMVRYKHSKGDQPEIEISAQTDKSICPVYWYNKFKKLRGSAKGAAFICSKNKAVTKLTFSKLLSKACMKAGIKPPFSSHCFRVGGASLAAQMGRTEPEIKLLGRWKSTAYNLYLRKADPLLINCSNRPRLSKLQPERKSTTRSSQRRRSQKTEKGLCKGSSH